MFHDQAVQLFPKYWAAVRKDFQFVSAGQVYPDNPEAKHAAAVGESSQGCALQRAIAWESPTDCVGHWVPSYSQAVG